MRFSNKIPKYSRFSVLSLTGQKSPAEQHFAGGVFALSFSYIGNSADLLHCSRDSALLVLWFFRLVFDNWFGGSIGIRCFLRLRIRFPVRSPVLSPARGPALSPTLPRTWSPTSTYRCHWLVRLVRIFRCKPSRLHSGALSAYTSGAGLSLPVIHAPVLWSHISALEASAASALNCGVSVLETSAASTLHCWASALETSAASTLNCGVSVLETSSASALHRGASTASVGHRSTLHHHVPASKTLAARAYASSLEALTESTHASALEALAVSTRASALPALDVLIRTLGVSTRASALPALAEPAHSSALEALTESALAWALPALNVLIRTLGERAIWARYPEIVRFCRLEVCVHLWSAGHSASPFLSAAATASASARTGKRLTGQNRHSQHNNDRCFDSCLFHFQFLSLMFHFPAYLGPLLGFFYGDSGAGGKKVTPGVNFSEKLFVLTIEKTGRRKTYQAIFVAIYFTSMFRLSRKSGIKAKNWNCRRAKEYMFGFKKRRRNRLAAQQFPAEWLAIIERNVPFYKLLPETDQKELQRHIQIFIGEKRFEGCGGLKITDEIKVTIAAQACMLLLHRRTDYYPGLHYILVYPRSYVAPRVPKLVGGIVVEGPDVRLGESWHRGSVVLSWDNVRRGTADIHDGHNVVFHEFAHQLDSSGARGDSTPVIQNHSTYIAWARILEKDYEKLRRDVSRNSDTFLDEYGAVNPAEFFAVATECFFEKAKELQELHPDLYNEMKNFYQQDPAEL